MILFVMAAEDFISESLAELSGWLPHGRGGTIRNPDPPGCWLQRPGHCQEVESWVRTARMHFLFRHNNKPFPNINISIFSHLFQIFSQCTMQEIFSRPRTIEISFPCFFIFCLNHLLQGWIQLFLQAPINPTINHGPNKIVLIINLPTLLLGMVRVGHIITRQSILCSVCSTKQILTWIEQTDR